MSTTVLVGLIRFSVEIFPAVSGALCADAKRADLLQPFAPASASVISASRLSPGTNGRTHLSNLRPDIGHVVWQLSQVHRLPLSNAVHEGHRCGLEASTFDSSASCTSQSADLRVSTGPPRVCEPGFSGSCVVEEHPKQPAPIHLIRMPSPQPLYCLYASVLVLTSSLSDQGIFLSSEAPGSSG